MPAQKRGYSNYTSVLEEVPAIGKSVEVFATSTGEIVEKKATDGCLV